MPVDEQSLTIPPPCDVSLHDMLAANPERAKENQAIRNNLNISADQSLKVKSPGPAQMRELERYFGEVEVDNLG